MANELVVLIEQNPIILWGGIVFAAIVFLVTRHYERMKAKEETDEAPRPSSLDEIVRPRVLKHIDDRGKKPSAETKFKIGRDVKGNVYQFLDTEMDAELLNPNPNDSGSQSSQDELPSSVEEGEMVPVRIVRVKPDSFVDNLREFILSLIAAPAPEESDDKLFVFRKSSFIDLPGDDMMVDPDALSYQFAGMEVEIDPATRNVVNQAVQGEVSEKLLAALPNYTEKVDYLFPEHSQSMKEIQQEGEHLQSDEGF